MRLITTLSRVFTGCLFIFSGFIKAVDPMGTAYKMMEYFTEFGLTFLEAVSVELAVLMVVLEIVLGITLLLGYQKKWTANLLLLLIVFFTFLTGYTSITGHVTDCGCFGDFLKLKPFQSFLKDIVLSVLILVIYFNQKYIDPILDNYIAAPIAGLATIGSFLFCFSNYIWDEPVFDFRPYKIGKNIPSQMTVAKEDMPVFEYFFIYKEKATGKEQEFTSANRPKGEEKEKWEFVKRIDKVIKEGKTPAINNFSISNEEGEEIKEEILSDTSGFVCMVIAYDLEKSNPEAFTKKIAPIAKELIKDNYRFFAVTSTSSLGEYKKKYEMNYPIYSADGTFLKTIMRSNPGFIILKNGTVHHKWHHNKLPRYEEIKAFLK